MKSTAPIVQSVKPAPKRAEVTSRTGSGGPPETVDRTLRGRRTPSGWTRERVDGGVRYRCQRCRAHLWFILPQFYGEMPIKKLRAPTPDEWADLLARHETTCALLRAPIGEILAAKEKHAGTGEGGPPGPPRAERGRVRGPQGGRPPAGGAGGDSRLPKGSR
jgi:hypothetical protein